MTTAINNIVRGGSQAKSLFDSVLPFLSSSVSYNQGDLIAFDVTNSVIKAVTGSGDGAQFLGVAPTTVVNGLPKQAYQGTAVDSSTGPSDMAGPLYSVVASLFLTSGDTFTQGGPIYLTTDAQTVTSTPAGSAIGVFVGPTVTPAASGSKGDCKVGLVYGGAGLQF